MNNRRPPRGWNSFDCFGAAVREDEVIENAEFLAQHLLPFGWDHVVVDYCWWHPGPVSCTNPNQMPEYQPYLAMDADFRLLPAPERFPSATGGRGFQPLARRIHDLGLKFGIHIMRGVPRQALYPGYPSPSLGWRAEDIADLSSTCHWLNHMIGVNPASEAGRAYYRHVFRLLAEWEVDFVKVDDIAFPYRAEELEALDEARRSCGRPILLSLSPGPCPPAQAEHDARHAEMWRIGADFWDDWRKLRAVFDLAACWAPNPHDDRWPDADMLPLGRLSKRGPAGPEHDSFLTFEEQRTMITFWCIFGSPLFMGGNLPETPKATLDLLRNPRVLWMHETARRARPLRQDEDAAIWFAEGTDGTNFVALFNFQPHPQTVSAQLDAYIDFPAPVVATDLWNDKDVELKDHPLNADLPAHGSCAFALKNANTRKQTPLQPVVRTHCLASRERA
jgi:hypothetical protein